MKLTLLAISTFTLLAGLVSAQSLQVLPACKAVLIFPLYCHECCANLVPSYRRPELHSERHPCELQRPAGM